jgi:2,4-dienoyl-CoA reductase-like NADH-dependent reductase (Old Yellow Enzyme family)
VLANELVLPCGSVIRNRIVKAAMTEGLATADGVPTPELERLYKIWSDGGAGVLISGNIQVDRDHLERPGNVVIDRKPDERMQEALARWASAATGNGNHFWAQLSHAGRQTSKAVNAHPKAPSAVKLALPGGQFGQPVALEPDEISDIVKRFAVAAAACKDAGFTGVQIHAAHGYLLSQFLSPRVNQRDDEYGGELANRARLLLDVVTAVHNRVGPGFPVAVKLNSADFQKGGFAFEDSLQVAQWLEEAGVDTIEISGGTYEQPKLIDIEGLEPVEQQDVPQSTKLREAYFVDFAKAMQDVVTIPLQVTGGFRKREAMEQAIESGSADLIGLARPMCVDTDAPDQLLAGLDELNRYEDNLSLLPRWLSFLAKIPMLKIIAVFSTMFWYYTQFHELARNGRARRDMSVFEGMRRHMKAEKWLLKTRNRSADR